MCESIEEGRFPSVGISDDTDSFEIVPFAILSMECASTLIGFELFEEGSLFFLQVSLHDLGIGLSLSLGILASTLARELHTHTIDTGSHMLDSGELYLQLGFWRDGMQCEYLEYQVNSVPGLDLGF